MINAKCLCLQRGLVKLVSHNSQWTILFAQEKSLLNDVLGGKALDIQHIGSTAVPELDAKPILDIAIAVADFSIIQEYVPLLEALGYTYFGDRDDKGDYFFAKGEEQNRTHYLHVVKHCGAEWFACLRFRDYLIANSEARQRYARLKHDLSRQYASDRAAYTEGKAALIQSLLEESARKAS